MKKPLLSAHLLGHYLKLKKVFYRLKQQFINKDFFSFTQEQQTSYLNRLNRCVQQLGFKKSFTTATLCLAFSMQVDAQVVFEANTDQMMSAFSTSSRSAPTFVDLDGDHDLDLVRGDAWGAFQYMKNEGGVFTEILGVGNPLMGFKANTSLAKPVFVDLDGDNDFDLVCGGNEGEFSYFANIGGVFTERIGIGNPFDGLDVGWFSAPTFVDLDGDNDLDLVSGSYAGGIKYYENNGGDFTEKTGEDNPLNSFNAIYDGYNSNGYSSTPCFVDLDGDNDLDLVSGISDGTFIYFQNDGGAFTEKTGANNPFDGFDAGAYSTPTFVDLDGDNDLDLVSGRSDGTLIEYRNLSNITGIESHSVVNSNLDVFPNPANAELNIETEEEIKSLAIYNAFGVLVQAENEKSFSVENLAQGVYVLDITTTNGVLRSRFTKE